MGERVGICILYPTLGGIIKNVSAWCVWRREERATWKAGGIPRTSGRASSAGFIAPYYSQGIIYVGMNREMDATEGRARLRTFAHVDSSVYHCVRVLPNVVRLSPLKKKYETLSSLDGLS